MKRISMPREGAWECRLSSTPSGVAPLDELWNSRG